MGKSAGGHGTPILRQSEMLPKDGISRHGIRNGKTNGMKRIKRIKWKAYNEAVAAAWKPYNEAVEAAQKAYNEAMAALHKAYYEAMAAAWTAYNEAENGNH